MKKFDPFYDKNEPLLIRLMTFWLSLGLWIAVIALPIIVGWLIVGAILYLFS